MNSTWIKLLENWQPDGMGNNGCTVPYLSGIGRVKSNDSKPEMNDILNIFEHLFQNRQSGEIFWLRFCPELKYNIIQKKIPTLPYAIDDEKGEWYCEGHLLIDKVIIDQYGKSEIEIKAGFVRDAMTLINQNKFSLFKSDWMDYTEVDRNFIMKYL
jgi:hypothetical protein